MNKTIKFIVLALVFAIPIAITTFIKIFGDHRYDVPVYFLNNTQEDNPDVGSCSDFSYPHLVNNTSLLKTLELDVQSDVDFLIFINPQAPISDELEITLHTFKEKIDRPFVVINLNQLFPFKKTKDYLLTTPVEPQRLSEVIQCELVLNPPFGAVMVDAKGQIRSYQKLNRKHVNDFVAEMLIIDQNNE